MAWLPGWQYRKKITISASNVDGKITNFPLYIPISRTTISGSQTTGNDIRFTLPDGTILDYIWTGFTDDGWNGAYIKIPLINASSDTSLYVYYGNDSATDASNAASVLGDYAVFAPLYNFTNGQTDLASGLIMTTGGTVGISSNGVNINNGYVQFGTNNNDVLSRLEGETGCTYSIVARDVNSVAYDDYLVFDTYANDYMIEWFLRVSEPRARLKPSNNSGNIDVRGSSIPNNVDQHAAFTYQCYDGTNPTTLVNYNDGAVNGSGTCTDTFTTLSFGASYEPTRLGGYWADTYRGVNASLTEFRIKKGAASAAWIKFENANLMTNGNQITFAREESLSNGPYQIAETKFFQTGIQQAETYIPGIITGHTYGT